jgi:hypothetical protein
MTSYLVEALRKNSIVAMLDTIGGYGAIVTEQVIPEELQHLRRLLQIYRVSPITPDDVQVLTYTVNCRQTNESDADVLASLVYGEINRAVAKYAGRKVYSQCTIHRSIFEGENLWNTPVDVRIYNA